MPSRFVLFLPMLLIVLAGLAVHLHGLNGPFIFDDISAIRDNPHIRQIWPPAWLTQAPLQSTVAGRPLVSLTLAINYAISRLEPWSYHLLNIALHLAAALLLLAVIRRCLTAPLLQGRYESSAPWMAGATALLWTIHPLQTEAVHYVIQRTELMVSFAWLATLYCSIRAFEAQRLPRLWLCLAVAASAAGMACKENMVAAPLLVLLVDRALFSGSFKAAWQQHRWLYVGLAASWLVLIALNITGPRNHSAGFDVGISSWEYLRTQAGVLLLYLKLIVWPYPLTLHYPWSIAHDVSQWLLPGLVIAALLAATAWLLKRKPALALAPAAFFMILAPTSSIVPIATELVAERRMHLPLAAVLLLLTLALAPLIRRRWGMPLVLILFTASMLASIFLSMDRLADYRSVEALWQHDVDHHPDSPVAHSELAVCLARAGKFERAHQHLQQSLRLDPTDPVTYGDLAMLLLLEHRNAEAIVACQKALRIDPTVSEAWVNLGVAQARLARTAEAAAAFQQAIELNPLSPQGHWGLGKALVELEQPAQGIIHIERFLQIAQDIRQSPRTLAEALDLVGVAHAMLGQMDQAIARFRSAIETDPSYAPAQQHLQKALAQ